MRLNPNTPSSGPLPKDFADSSRLTHGGCCLGYPLRGGDRRGLTLTSPPSPSEARSQREVVPELHHRTPAPLRDNCQPETVQSNLRCRYSGEASLPTEGTSLFPSAPRGPLVAGLASLDARLAAETAITRLLIVTGVRPLAHDATPPEVLARELLEFEGLAGGHQASSPAALSSAVEASPSAGLSSSATWT